MDVSKEIIEKSFALVEKSTSNPALDDLLEALAIQSENDIINHSAEARKIDGDIHSLWIGVTYPISHGGSDIVTNVAAVVKSMTSYLSKAILNGDLKSLLIFLSANCYLRAEVVLFLKYFGLDIKPKEPLSEKINGLLGNFRFQVVLPANTPYHERQLKSAFDEGFREADIDKVYELILAFERSGRGFHFNFLLENLLQFFFVFDQQRFCLQLTSLTHPQELVFYLQSFSKDDLIEIINCRNYDNKWLLHELIRQIIEKEKKDEGPNDSDKQCVSTCLRGMHKIDSAFYLKSVSFFHRSRLFNASLGRQLAGLEIHDVTEVITSALPIDKYAFNLSARTLLLEEFGRVATPEKLQVMALSGYNKWKNLYDNLYRSDDYQNDLLVTDYGNFVAQYLSMNNNITDLLKAALEKIRWINCEWAIDETKQITHYNLYMTDIYLLSCAFKDKGLIDPEISKLLVELRASQDFEMRFSTEKSEVVELIDSNINWHQIDEVSKT